MLCGLCLDSAVVEQAVDHLSGMRSTANRFIPAFTHEREFHGIQLSARVKKGEKAKAIADGRALLRDHERAYLYQHAMHTTAALPGHLRVYTAGLKVIAGGRPKDDEKGRIVRTLMEQFLHWILDEETEVAQATVDRGDQWKYNVRGYDAVATSRSGLLSQIEVVPSHEHLLVQMADLACYAAFRRVKSTEDDPRRHPGLQQWYQEILEENWAEGCGAHGVKHLGSL